MPRAARVSPASAVRPALRIRDDSTLSTRVARALEEQIVDGSLEAGSKLPNEAELGEAFGVSRSVVRDAIRSLAVRGLLDVRQGRGMVVTEPDDLAYSDAVTLLLKRSSLTMGDVIDARRTLDVSLIPLAARSVTEQDLAQLGRDLDAMQRASSLHSWDEVSHHHVRFHMDLLAALHLPALSKLLEPLQEVIVLSATPPGRGPDLWGVPIHKAILDALRAHDEDAVRRALEDHYADAVGPQLERWASSPFRHAAAQRR